MKAIKRTIAALLASLMLMTSVNVGFAEEAKNEKFTDSEAIAVAKVGAAGIMTGTEKGFEGEASLTRAQAAAIMVRIKGIAESQVASAKGTTLFGDVPADHWAAGYINVASNYGIINGVGDGKFDPERAVSVAEVYTMAIRALGAGKLVDSDSSSWPTNYVNFAGENELTDKVNQIYTQEAKRITAAQIIANTLEANVWEKESVKTNGEITWTKNENKTLLEETLKIEKYDDVTISNVNLKDREISVEGKLTNAEVSDKVDLGSIKKGVKYDVWYNADTKVKQVIGVWESESSKQKVVKFDEIVKATDKEITVKVDGAEKKYDLVSSKDKKDEATKITFNNKQEVDFAGSVAGTKLVKDENAFGTITLDGSKVSAINIEKYTNAGVVEKVTDKKIEFKSVSNSKAVREADDFKLTDDDLVYSVTKDGKEIKVSDIKEGDVVFYYNDEIDKDIFNVLVATNKVEGKITSVSKSDDNVKYVKIDGKKYDCLEGLSFEADDEVVLFLNKAGKVVLSDEVEAKNTSYAVVKEMQFIEDNKGKITAEVKLVTADGKETETKEIDLDETCEELIGSEWKNDSYKEAIREYVIGVLRESADPSISDCSVTALNKDHKFAADKDNFRSNANILGSIVRYKEKSGKIVLTEVFEQEADVKNQGLKELKNDKITLVEDGTLAFGNKSYIEEKKVANGKKFYFTDSTVFMTIKADSSKGWKTKVEVVKKEDLDNSSNVIAYVANYNSDNEAKLVLLVNNKELKREKVEDFAIVLSKADLGNDADYKYVYEIAYANKEGICEVKSDEEAIEGEIYEVQANGDVVTSFDHDDYDEDKGKVKEVFEKLDDKTIKDAAQSIMSDCKNLFISESKNGHILLCAASDEGKYYDVATGTIDYAKNVAFIKYTKNGEYKTGKESDIKELDGNGEATAIKTIYVYVDENGIIEIVGVIYYEDNFDITAYGKIE